MDSRDPNQEGDRVMKGVVKGNQIQWDNGTNQKLALTSDEESDSSDDSVAFENQVVKATDEWTALLDEECKARIVKIQKAATEGNLRLQAHLSKIIEHSENKLGEGREETRICVIGEAEVVLQEAAKKLKEVLKDDQNKQAELVAEHNSVKKKIKKTKKATFKAIKKAMAQNGSVTRDSLFDGTRLVHKSTDYDETIRTQALRIEESKKELNQKKKALKEQVQQGSLRVDKHFKDSLPTLVQKPKLVLVQNEKKPKLTQAQVHLDVEDGQTVHVRVDCDKTTATSGGRPRSESTGSCVDINIVFGAQMAGAIPVATVNEGNVPPSTGPSAEKRRSDFEISTDIHAPWKDMLEPCSPSWAAMEDPTDDAKTDDEPPPRVPTKPRKPRPGASKKVRKRYEKKLKIWNKLQQASPLRRHPARSPERPNPTCFQTPEGAWVNAFDSKTPLASTEVMDGPRSFDGSDVTGKSRSAAGPPEFSTLSEKAPSDTPSLPPSLTRTISPVPNQTRVELDKLRAELRREAEQLEARRAELSERMREDEREDEQLEAQLAVVHRVRDNAKTSG